MAERVIVISGISHTIILDSDLSARYSDALSEQLLPEQPRWRWYACVCKVKGDVPYVLMIEAGIGYLMLVPLTADSAYEFGLDVIHTLMETLDIHPDDHKQPHASVFSFEQNPERIHWQVGVIDELALRRRMNEAVVSVETMSPFQARATVLFELNQQPLVQSFDCSSPKQMVQQRLDHYAHCWDDYMHSTGFIRHIWDTLRRNKPWVNGVEA